MKSNLLAGVIFSLALFATQAVAIEIPEKILLATGFEPFGGDRTNGSWEALKDLNGKHFAGTKVITAQLPVVWDKATSRLQELIRTYKPTAVISFGQAGSEPVQLETTAHNIRGAISDNEGKTPQSSYIYQQSPPSIENSLPLAEIEGRLRSAGIPVTMSQDAGTYLCNDTFYTLMLRPGTEEAKNIQRGFIHVPPLNAKVRTSDGKLVIFDKSLLKRTAEIVVQTVIDRTEISIQTNKHDK